MNQSYIVQSDLVKLISRVSLDIVFEQIVSGIAPRKACLDFFGNLG
jgi:hypothetical protein